MWRWRGLGRRVGGRVEVGPAILEDERLDVVHVGRVETERLPVTEVGVTDGARGSRAVRGVLPKEAVAFENFELEELRRVPDLDPLDLVAVLEGRDGLLHDQEARPVAVGRQRALPAKVDQLRVRTESRRLLLRCGWGVLDAREGGFHRGKSTLS